MSKVISKTETGKTVGSSGLIIEMIKAVVGKFVDYLVSLFNEIVDGGVIQRSGIFQISIFQRRDAVSRGNYRGIKLQSQFREVIEHVLNIIRE